mmetsp:Transcript_80999/g.99224  ORF Transcript_80999/g.99224 Transcript_80999/m.99224 type:complete len:105 (-) Transcript_80999:131-445(-)
MAGCKVSPSHGMKVAAKSKPCWRQAVAAGRSFHSGCVSEQCSTAVLKILVAQDPAPRPSTDARVWAAAFSSNAVTPREIVKLCPTVTCNAVALFSPEVFARIGW